MSSKRAMTGVSAAWGILQIGLSGHVARSSCELLLALVRAGVRGVGPPAPCSDTGARSRRARGCGPSPAGRPGHRAVQPGLDRSRLCRCSACRSPAGSTCSVTVSPAVRVDVAHVRLDVAGRRRGHGGRGRGAGARPARRVGRDERGRGRRVEDGRARVGRAGEAEEGHPDERARTRARRRPTAASRGCAPGTAGCAARGGGSVGWPGWPGSVDAGAWSRVGLVEVEW